MVTCPDPQRCVIGAPEFPDIDMTTAGAGVWVVTFPGVDGANGPPDEAWAIYEATTGSFVMGDWP